MPPLPSTISHPSGRPNSVAQPGAHRADHAACTGSWRWEVPSHVPPASASASHGLGPHLGRAAAEPAVGGQQRRRGSRMCGVVGRGHCVSMAAVERISGALPRIAESATLAVDAKAKALKAAGEDVIGFGAGEPDFPTPDAIVEAAAAACRDPANHRYTPTGGLPELREAIVAKTQARLRASTCTEAQVLVTNGGKQPCYNTFAALLDPGDEVLLPAPYWTTYPESITLAGGMPVVVPHRRAAGFRVTIDQLDAARTPRTKALVFVSPEPERRRVPARRGRGDRPVGGRARASGSSPTRSTSTSPTATTRSRRCRCSCPSSPTRASSSTASPRPTR